MTRRDFHAGKTSITWKFVEVLPALRITWGTFRTLPPHLIHRIITTHAQVGLHLDQLMLLDSF